LLQDLGNVVIALHAIIGIFWDAPLAAHELETGPHRLVWTQSVTRTRWIAVKLGLVGLASIAVTGLFSLMMTWWSSPIDRVNVNRFTFGVRPTRHRALERSPLGPKTYLYDRHAPRATV